jgi:hypothetical protein
MKTFLTLLLVTLCAASGYGQTIKTLGYNTTNGQVVYSGTNMLNFPNAVTFNEDIFGSYLEIGSLQLQNNGIVFSGTNAATAAATTRTNLSLGATWLTNTNVTNFRAAIGLGGTDTVSFDTVYATAIAVQTGTNEVSFDGEGIVFTEVSAATTRTNLSLGASNIVTFAGLTNNGDITINSTTASNGLLYIRRTNNEPFLGLANLIASNNTTISNETLFRVGVAEATNKAAQFGFRTVRTNNGGEGVAVFSVFGYNALMMIGPSDRSRTNTATNAGIEADIWTISPTNRVATLRDTNSGAFTLHQELGFSTNNINTNAPATNNAVALWLRVWVGTNSYRLPLYQ